MSLPVSRLVVRASDLQARRDAVAIVSQAHADVARLRDVATREGAAERERGYVDGLSAGSRAGAQLVERAAIASQEFLAAREAELTELAFAIAARVLGALPQDAALAAIARQALDEHRADARLVLRVWPAAAAGMRAALARDRVEIQADPEAAEGSCILVHSRGTTALGIVEQLRALMTGAGP